MSISDVCLHVHETLKSKKVKGLVPEYNCLIVSPANLWGMDRTKFEEDGQIMKTVFKQYGPVLDTPPSIRGNLYGKLFVDEHFIGLNFLKYIWSDDSWQNNTVLDGECKDTIPVEK